MKILLHEGWEELSKIFAATPSLQLQNTRGKSDPEITTLLAESDVLISSEFKEIWGGTEKAGSLKVVHSTGAGIDGIEIASLPPGCVVCNVYGHGRGVTEQAFLLILALQRNLLKLDFSLRKGDWTPRPTYLPELGNRNLLILGLGHIGMELVRWGHFLDMNVTALTRSPSKVRRDKLGLKSVGGLDELEKHLGEADFIVVAIPNAPGTTNLIGKKEFQQMKADAFLINVGRAAVVNEEALYQALKTRRIAGAGLDVWYQYPAAEEEILLPSTFPFHELDNVIMTPHKPTIETMEYRWAKIAENVAGFARGAPLENIAWRPSL